MMWYVLTLSNSAEGGEITARVQVPETSPWFSGHFPGFPVLPGIAQIAMVRDTIARAVGGRVRVSTLRRIRFKQMIGPGDTLNVTVARHKRPDEFAFRITDGPELVCSGILETIREPEGPEEALE